MDLEIRWSDDNWKTGEESVLLGLLLWAVYGLQNGGQGFHLLTSSRGRRIWVPEINDNIGQIYQMAGIRVRTYIDFPPASEKKELYRKEDTRFLERV